LDDPIQLLEAPFPSQPGLVPNFRWDKQAANLLC
jgi:hypothetical protein